MSMSTSLPSSALDDAPEPDARLGMSPLSLPSTAVLPGAFDTTTDPLLFTMMVEPINDVHIRRIY
ncbi:hypothetical protein BDN72DRAFT_844930 [Pluteus cervinus]|uniref:Uncharacterized protein n=1 Tax=Pluteus cervinus TaxID=181527 RepID=A0ACD3AJY4_9AGAR|nr:hypothetical protein BDN72DRAFT_844930 [Pluteus cervinus]